MDSNTTSEWKELARFSWYQEALILKTTLEGNGIECQIPEQFTGTIEPAMTAMQVRVLVRSSQYEEAKEYLAAVESEPQVCKNCGKSEFIAKPRKARNWFTFLVGVLTFSPMRRSTTKVCSACGAEK